MDINKLLKNVNNVDEYISVTQEITDNCKNAKVQINITTVLALKKIRALEIEYFNKCYKNGAACILFERLLNQPASKTWGVLGKELISLLQYWLEAIRKYLINHNVHWWIFLKLILKFIKEIRLKDLTLPNMLVGLTAECIFDIASSDHPNPHQHHEMLHCLNMVCAESSREIRFAMRTKFGDFFTKLSSQLATSGFLPAQYSALEALVRWLVPRQDRALRAGAAARWFPDQLCPAAARDIFLNTTWMNFFQDARDFLNALNEANGLVTSVVCRRLTVGKILIVTGAEKQQTWLDVNTSGKCISVLLDPRMLETFGVMEHRACETLLIADDNMRTAQLHSESQELIISLNTYRPPRVQPSDIAMGDASDVSIVVSSRVDLKKLDTALRSIFGDKYHLLMDLDSELSLSPARSHDTRKNQNGSEEDTRFSHPVEVRRKKHSGFKVRSKNAGGLISPSTASTSSLAQLHDKLAALPRYKYDKEPVSICAQPQLSSVTEITEADNRSFHSMSTLKIRPYGVCYKNPSSYSKSLAKSTKNKAESDSETLKLKPKLGRRLSPIVSDDNTASCLLVATLGSVDDSVINDTVQRLSKSKDYKDENIVDLLVQEAMQAKAIKEKIVDSGINSRDQKSQEENSEAIENTPVQDDEVKETSKKNRVAKKKICTVVSKSTTDDESNTEAINETPVFVNPRKVNFNQSGSKTTVPKVTDKQVFEVQTVEEFFSQHFAETKAGEIAISPTLAKKINESSSDTSENFDDNYLIMNEDLNADVEQFEFNDIEIIECLNDMVDQVCCDFEKCTVYLNEDSDVLSKNGAGLVENQAKVLKKTCTNVSVQQTNTESKPKRNLKLSYNAKKDKRTRIVAKKRRNSINQKSDKKMSTIIEQKDEEIPISSKHHKEKIETAQVITPVIEETESRNKEINTKTPPVKRKRKLYSPKDDDIEKEIKETKASEMDSDDVVLSEFKTSMTITTPKTTATCYKDIERERQKHIRLPRSRKLRGKIEESPSPRTLKMNAVFDKLQSNVENKEQIILADKNTTQSKVYNYTSDSEDEDFKKKKIEIQKHNSTTTIGSFDSTKSTRAGRSKARLNYSEKLSNDEAKKTKPVRRKKAVKKTNSKNRANVELDPFIVSADERMREAGPDVLNTSIVVENSKAKQSPVVELYKAPQMERITDEQETSAPEKKKLNKKTKKVEYLTLKKGKDLKNNELQLISDKDDDRTSSPLPGLVVESIPTHREDANDSVTGTMLQKFKKIYQDGQDPINESSTTQNMLLSDIERCNYSPQNVSTNITDEICFVDYNKGILEGRLERENVEKKIASKKTIPHLNLRKNKKKNRTESTSSRKDITDKVIEISEIPDAKSEKSIATDGITAHGDLDEAPPSPDMIRKSMHPREIEDLNESMKDYYIKLNREIYDSTFKERRKSSKSTEGAEVRKIMGNVFEKSPSLKSPSVCVQRLSFDDISKWLPSRRTTETSSSTKSSPRVHKVSEIVLVHKEPKPSLEIINKQKHEDMHTPKVMQTRKAKQGKQVKQPSVKSPEAMSPLGTAPIGTISLEEFNMWLPMPKETELEDKAETSVSPLHFQRETRQSNLRLVYNTRQKSNTKKIEEVKIPDVETKRKNTKTVKAKATQLAATGKNKSYAVDDTTTRITEPDSDVTSVKIKTSSKNKTKRASKAKNNKEQFKKTSDSDSDEHIATKADKDKKTFQRSNSVISPIKSFEDFVPNIHKSDESEDDHCIKKIRDVLSKQRVKTNISKRDTTLRKPIQDTQSPTKSTIIGPSQSSRKLILEESTSTQVKEQLESFSTKRDQSKSTLKRKSSPVLGQDKRMRIDANLDAVTIGSGPSVSSVSDWFRRMEPSGSRENVTNLSFRDMIQNIVEKLDTTLVENNRNTSAKLVNLFVEAQMQLATQQEERRKIYKTVATQIITEMVSIMDDKFADLDRRSQETDAHFKEQLKKQAFDLIREDCNQKRVMVLLLKEDVQAVFDHIERSRTESP